MGNDINVAHFCFREVSMATTRVANRRWLIIIVLLLAIIVGSSIMLWMRYPRSQAIEISLLPPYKFQGEIYISGAVSNPGFYPLRAGDSVEALIQAAGGAASGADLSNLKLYIPEIGVKQQPQKIDINRAEAWLLQALPDIGDTRAKAIIEYRKRNGPFHNTYELTRVEGIGTTTYEKIKRLVTVGD